MRIPLSWLREYAAVPADATAEDVMAELVKVGLEEEDVHRPTDELTGPIVVGQVLSAVKEPQSNGKTINWCQVRVVPEGAEQTLAGDGIDPSGVQGIVCGAHRLSAIVSTASSRSTCPDWKLRNIASAPNGSTP